MTGRRVTTSTKRRGCDCKNLTPQFTDAPNSGLCEYCNEVIVTTGTGTDQLERQAPCYFIALFGCDHYTQDDEREHVAVPCLVLRKRCNHEECIWDSRWQCQDGNPTNDQPLLTTNQCYLGQSSSDDLNEFQPCRDVNRCGGQMFVAEDVDPSLVQGCVVSDAFNVLCCMYYWIFDDTINDLCPEFAPQWANVDSRDLGQYERCCFCEDWDGLGNGPICTVDIDGDGTADFSHRCPKDRVGFPDWNCCSADTLVEVGPEGADPPYHSYVLDCIFCGRDQSPTERDYEAFRQDPTSYCNYQILHRGEPVEDCTWADDPCEGTDNCASPGTEFGEGTGTSGDELDGISCFTKWQLIPTSTTTAIFRGRSRRGYYANYVCNDWNCYERRTFTLETPAGESYSPEMVGLPPCLCIAPHNFRSPSCADSGRLACCDAGESTMNVFINNIVDCDGNLIYNNVWWPFARGADLPCGVANPFPYDPCLYFAAVIPIDEGCAEWGGDLLAVMYCNANNPIPGYDRASCGIGDPGGPFFYDFAFYCLNRDTDCWEFQGGQCGSFTCECLGPNPPGFSFTKDCCCENVCCDPAPSQITVSDGTNSVVLNKTSDFPAAEWAGQGKLGACTSDEIPEEAEWQLICNAEQAPNLLIFQCTNCDSTLSINIESWSCDPFEAEVEVGGCITGTLTFTE